MEQSKNTEGNSQSEGLLDNVSSHGEKKDAMKEYIYNRENNQESGDKVDVEGSKNVVNKKVKKEEDTSDNFSKYDRLCRVLFAAYQKIEFQKVKSSFINTGDTCENVPECIADMSGRSESKKRGHSLVDTASQYTADTMYTEEQISESKSQVLRAKEEYFKNIEMHKFKSLFEINGEDQSTESVVGNAITVKFKMKSLNILTCAFKIDTNIREVKEKVAGILNTKSDNLTFFLYENEIDEWLPLAGLGIGPFGTLELEITSTDPNLILPTESSENYIPIVDVITVKVLQDEGKYKSIVVEIENQCFTKEWLGGYRNRKTKVEYYHADAQTKYWQPDNQPDRFCRDTQTPFPLKTTGIDTPANKATQMWRSDHYIPCEDDKIMVARPYKVGIEYPQTIIAQVIVIQKYVRGWITRNQIKQWKLYLAQCLVVEENIRQKNIAETNEEKRELLVRQAFPSSRNDFYMLYTMVGKWVEKERKRIKALKTEEPKKAEYAALLQKEIRMLSTIEKHKVACKKELLRKQEMIFLEETSKPKVFTDRLGKLVSMDTIATQRAREFKEIYSTFIRTDLKTQERIDMLMTLRHLLQNYKSFEWTKEIILLLERECDLLNVGLKDADLVDLRKRTELLLMDFICKPEINPQATKYRKPGVSKTINTLYSCTHCQKLLPVSSFPVHTRMTALNICTSCEWIKNFSHLTIDLSPYKRLLKLVRDSEMQRCCFSSECYVLQEMGMYFLMHIIWQGKSVISANDDVPLLRMVRWHDDQEWSVNNCVLLTQEEAMVHRKVKDIYTFYSKIVVDFVKKKHLTAKLNFKMLLNINNHLKHEGIWSKIQSMTPILRNTKFDDILKNGKELY